jgi:hypothetical protein
MAAKKKAPALMRREVAVRLDDLPRQLLALESAMEEFGLDFELSEFKLAFEGKSGIKAYNKVQAVERAFSRVQNYVVELAEYGSRLAASPEGQVGGRARVRGGQSRAPPRGGEARPAGGEGLRRSLRCLGRRLPGVGRVGGVLLQPLRRETRAMRLSVPSGRPVCPDHR